MEPKRVLFVSGSIGLGHVTRDLAMVRALRALLPVEVTWLAGARGRSCGRLASGCTRRPRTWWT
jgi:hypothetical protein